MSADFEKNCKYFVEEVAPYLQSLEGCFFEFDFEKRKLIIHCKDAEHRCVVNLNIEEYLLFIPGERFCLGAPGEHYYDLSLKFMIEYYSGYITRHPETVRKYFHF